jgi:hypothetical protein
VEAGPLLDKIQSGRYDLAALERFRSKYIQTADENNTATIARFLLDHIPAALRTQRQPDQV